MNFLLVEGEKGLYYTDGHKFYFPDRRWKGAREGFATNLQVTVDKGNYAFITGEMIEPAQFDVSDSIAKSFKFFISSNSSNKFINSESISDTIMVGQWNGYTILRLSEIYYIKTKEGVVPFISCNSYSQHRDLFSKLNLKSFNLAEFILSNDLFKVSDNDVLDICINIQAVTGFYYKEISKEISIYNNSLFEAITEVGYRRYYIFDMESDTLVQLMGINISNLVENIKLDKNYFSWDFISKYCMNNFILLKGNLSLEPVVTAYVDVFNTVLEVKCFNGKVFKSAIRDKYIDEVTKSWNEFKKNRVKLSSVLSKKQLQAYLSDLAKLTNKGVLIEN